jgi:hypothetical protein
VSNDILIAYIGAAGSVGSAWGAAYITARWIPQEFSENKGGIMKIGSIVRQKWFVWLVAPLVGLVLWAGGYRLVQVHAAALPLKAPFSIDGVFYPSGFMGDGEDGKHVQLNTQWKESCHTAPCYKITYDPGSKGWAGIYWQYPDQNWGKDPGREIKGAKVLEFWVKGDKGGEVVSFKVGGINREKYKDSLEEMLGPIVLTTEWQRLEIDLSHADTSSIIGAFACIAQKDGNPAGLTFYLDDIYFK